MFVCLLKWHKPPRLVLIYSKWQLSTCRGYKIITCQTVLDFKKLIFFTKFYRFLQSHCEPYRCETKMKLKWHKPPRLVLIYSKWQLSTCRGYKIITCQTVLDFKKLIFFTKFYRFLQSHCEPYRCETKMKLKWHKPPRLVLIYSKWQLSTCRGYKIITCQTVLDFKKLIFFTKFYRFLQSHCEPYRCETKMKLKWHKPPRLVLIYSKWQLDWLVDS